MQGLYPIRAVAKITGLSLDTLRAWERRYRAVVPERSQRGRQYKASDVARLELLGELVNRGHAIGSIAKLSDDLLRQFLARPIAPRPDAASFVDTLLPILDAIDNFDAGLAGDELSRLAAVLTPRDVVYQVAVPLMREVGARWHSGTLGIAQEHLISQLLRNLFGGMMRLYRSPAAKTASRKMVFATPSGETHEFGILAAAMLASIAGVDPVYLGANLPAGEIVHAARRTQSHAIVLGITFPMDSTGDEIAAIATDMPDRAQLWLGGAGAASLNLSSILSRSAGRPVFVKDLSSLENACRQGKA